MAARSNSRTLQLIIKARLQTRILRVKSNLAQSTVSNPDKFQPQIRQLTSSMPIGVPKRNIFGFGTRPSPFQIWRPGYFVRSGNDMFFARPWSPKGIPLLRMA